MKRKMHPFFKILLILFIIYIFLYFAKLSGYYEGSIRRKTVLTEEKRLQFEKDILDNKEININDYIEKKKDYSNLYTRGANFIANKLGDLIDNKADNLWEYIKILFTG